MGKVSVTGAIVNAHAGRWQQGFMTVTGNGIVASDNADMTAATVENDGDWVGVGTQQIHAGQLTGIGQFELTNLNVNGTTSRLRSRLTRQEIQPLPAGSPAREA